MSMRIAIVNDNEGNLLVLSRILEKQSPHKIVWLAKDGAEAVEKCLNDTPDIILMDLVMPVMNGVEATRLIMNQCPCAILIATVSVTTNASMVFEAMGAGAIDAVKTPVLGDYNTDHDSQLLLQKIATIQNLIAPGSRTNRSMRAEEATPEPISSSTPILAIGASTGGPAVLATILGQLPVDFPVPVVIIQHVDQYFARNFAEWLDKQCPLSVRIARDGDTPEAGTVLIAGTNEHLVMQPNKQLTYAESATESHYKPSVNVFFESLAKHWDSYIIACLLTGMGRDGAAGLMQIRQKGGYTITQNEDTCAVYGMPKAADEMGSSMQSLAPGDIVQSVMDLLEHKKSNKADQA
ncbi:chemotaxis response regulator protein-glutamate methylesterase [Sulfuriflexus sp.]|uniref:chemotaxis response regulator protein-glutamate methylesterase n=1 Tax=Sulfuriflexus sp. TaxID=2015443 RepID=UPI0028D7A0AA|nr:chemotaxis response regulator protein-glutamate methylesterase [Sulfuriflexus sp.]